MRIRRGVVCALALLHGALLAGHAQAQSDYPTRPIRFIVGFAAGGGNDFFARLVVQKFQENTGVTAIVENKAGAGGRIAAELCGASAGRRLYGPGRRHGTDVDRRRRSYPDLTYHPTKSFIPLNMIASFPLVLVVPATIPIERERAGGLGEGPSRQIELRHLGACLYHRQRTVEA